MRAAAGGQLPLSSTAGAGPTPQTAAPVALRGGEICNADNDRQSQAPKTRSAAEPLATAHLGGPVGVLRGRRQVWKAAGRREVAPAPRQGQTRGRSRKDGTQRRKILGGCEKPAAGKQLLVGCARTRISRGGVGARSAASVCGGGCPGVRGGATALQRAIGVGGWKMRGCCQVGVFLQPEPPHLPPPRAHSCAPPCNWVYSRAQPLVQDPGPLCGKILPKML